MPPRGDDPESTAVLLERVRQEDEGARDELVRRFLPPLQRWARGRLPIAARDLADTDDLVQSTFLRALERVEEFVPRDEGSFLAYLRRILMNRIRDEFRKTGRRARPGALDEAVPDPGPSPLEEAIGREAVERYEEALSRLTAEQRDAVVLRLELGFSHQEIADALGSPSWNAARMLVARGLVRVAEVMNGRR